MAGKTAILSLKIIGDATSAQKAAVETEKSVSGLEKTVAGVNKGMKLAGAAAGGALLLGLNQAIENDTSTRKLAGSMGLDPAEQETAGRIAGSLYANAYGGSMEEVNAAIKGVSTTLADLSTNGGADVERLTKKALDVAAAFPEIGDAVGSAGILIKTGLAKNADEAFDLIVGSAQKLPAGMEAELLPVMDEYSKHFADLGIDGTTAFGIMVQASKGGAIQMDKTGDALKEFTIRATDGSKATAAAYKSIGLDAEEMARKIAAGGPEAQEAFAKTVAGLQSIEDPAAQAQAAIGLFGTPLEDLGTAKVPEFLGAIDPMGDSFDSLAGKADEMSKTMNTGPGVALETLKRTAIDSFTQIAANALPVLEPIIAFLMQFAPILGPIAVAIAVVAAAQWVWNAAMSANPIGIVIIAIAALVAGIIWAYNNVGWFKDAVNTAGAIAAMVFQTIGDWIASVIAWLDRCLAPVGGIQGALDILGAAAAIIWQGIVDGVTNVIKWLNDVLAPVGGIEGAVKNMGAAAGIIFSGMADGIAGVVGWVKDAIGWFEKLFGAQSKAEGAGGGSGGGTFGAGPDDNPGGFGAGPDDPGFGSYGGAGGTSASLSGAVASRMQSNVTYINVEVKADATTDRVALGRELDKALSSFRRATGKVGIA